MKEYSEEEKEKYVRGFKKCTLPLYEYARKMKINPEDLKQWLKKDNGSALFGKIEMKDIIADLLSKEEEREKRGKLAKIKRDAGEHAVQQIADIAQNTDLLKEEQDGKGRED